MSTEAQIKEELDAAYKIALCKQKKMIEKALDLVSLFFPDTKSKLTVQWLLALESIWEFRMSDFVICIQCSEKAKPHVKDETNARRKRVKRLILDYLDDLENACKDGGPGDMTAVETVCKDGKGGKDKKNVEKVSPDSKRVKLAVVVD